MKSGFQKIRLVGLVGITLLWTLSGCAQMGGVGERPRKGPAYYEHKVKWAGETLSIISKWYTGSFENWTVLAKINPGMDPNRMHMGERVRIPENIMKTKKPMPESFVASLSPEMKKAPPATPDPEPFKPKTMRTPPSEEDKAKPPTEEEEPQLFGPKPYPKK